MNSVRIPLSQYDLIVELRPLAPAPVPGKRTRRAPRLTTPTTPEAVVKRLTLSAACWSDSPNYLRKVLLQLPDVVSVAFEPKEKA